MVAILIAKWTQEVSPKVSENIAKEIGE